MNKDKKLRLIVFAMLLLIVAVFIIKLCPVVLQNDTLYDIKLGERYFNIGMFHIDDYSFHTGLIYQTHHYLVCIISYLVYHFFSLKGLYFLEVILLSIIGVLFYEINKTMIKNKFLIYLLLFFEIMALYPFVSLRAQMYSYIIFMIEILFIEKFLNTNRKKDAIVLALLPLLLINLHSGVIYFYFIIIFTYLMNCIPINSICIKSDERVGKKQLKSLLLISAVGGLLTLINPYGIDGITYGLKTLDNYYISNYITEFLPLKIFSSMGLLFTLYVGTCVVCLVFSRRKIKIHQLLLLGGTIFMTLLSVRHLSLLIITSVVLLPHIEGAYKRIDDGSWSLLLFLKKKNKVLNTVFIGLYIVALSYMVINITLRDREQLPNNQYPIDATEYIKSNISKEAHIYNYYEWGSYLMFNDIKVFVDSRCDLFTTEYNTDTTVFRDYVETFNNPKNYTSMVSKYDIDYFLLYKEMKLSKQILKDAKYSVVYSDDVSIIFKAIK